MEPTPPVHRLEPELEPPPPRPIPEEVREGPWWSRRRRLLRVLALLGLVALGLGRTGACDRLGETFVPLGYLDVGGALLLGGALLTWGWWRVALPAPLQLLQEGDVLVGELIALTRVPRAEHEGRVTAVGYEGSVEVQVPGGARRFRIASPNLGLDVETTLRLGDQVTLLRRAGDNPLDATLYGFLELTRSSSVLLRPSSTALSAFALVTLFGGLFLTLVALSIYEPLDTPGWLLGASGAGAACLGAMTRVKLGGLRRAQEEEAARRKAERREGGPDDVVPRTLVRPWLLTLVVTPLWFGLCIVALIGVNGAFDADASTLRAARVLRRTEKTHTAVGIPLFRELEVEWAPLAGGTIERTTQPLERVLRLADDEPAGVEVGPGALGVPWVRAIHPAAIDGADLVVDVDGRLERISSR